MLKFLGFVSAKHHALIDICTKYLIVTLETLLQIAVIHGSMINSRIVIPRNLSPNSCATEMMSKQLLMFYRY